MGSVRRKGVSKKKKRSPLAEHIGNQLLKCRQGKQLAMRKLAKISGLSVSFVCDLENGIMQPSAETIWRLSEALDVAVNYWFDGFREDANDEV